MRNHFTTIGVNGAHEMARNFTADRIADAGALPAHATGPTRGEIWTRVMGYHRPVASFNLGKQSKFSERRFFIE